MCAVTARFGLDGVCGKRRVGGASFLLLLLTVFAACSNSGSVEQAVGASDPPSGGKPRSEVAASRTTSGAEEVSQVKVGEMSSPSGEPFVANPEASGGSDYEADAMLAIRYGVHEGFERVVLDRKSTRLNSSHANISYAVFCLKKKKKERNYTVI